MLPTPSTSHVDFSHIYEPAEDTYLLLDTLSSSTETHFLRERFPGGTHAPLVLEVGTGSGAVLAFVTAHALELFGRSDVATLGTDVNSFACRATAKTVEVAAAGVRDGSTIGSGPAVFLDSVAADLSHVVRPGAVDVLICNPPYVPTESCPVPRPEESLDHVTDHPNASARFERDSHLLSLSYAGGLDGMEMTNRLLELLPTVLSERGVGYVLLCAQNRPADTIARVAGWAGDWRVEQVGTSGRKAGWEKLCVLRIWRKGRTSR